MLLSSFPPDRFAECEYTALRSKELALMTSQRLQIWGLYLSLVTAFGIAYVGIADGLALYLPGVLPLLISFLARYARHGEDVLKQVRKYLYHLEKQSNYQGYEHYSRTVARPTHGGHMHSMRDTFLLTEAGASVLVIGRLFADHLIVPALLLLIVEIASLVATYRWLRK